MRRFLSKIFHKVADTLARWDAEDKKAQSEGKKFSSRVFFNLRGKF